MALSPILTGPERAPKGSAMLARLGQVLSWAGNGIAALLLLAAAALIAFPITSPNDNWIFVAIVGGAGIASWLIGRACLYVLAGRELARNRVPQP